MEAARGLAKQGVWHSVVIEMDSIVRYVALGANMVGGSWKLQNLVDKLKKQLRLLMNNAKLNLESMLSIRGLGRDWTLADGWIQRLRREKHVEATVTTYTNAARIGNPRSVPALIANPKSDGLS
ncbi:hypothetical protein CRG98_032295 [Punica granatum]|uniref:Uncharacterized protein n=1 Tax=Punica granatum TaxID=22663 RepID=A0A2I0IUI3_PUNGR|nr:hypothetical protein CRG98_032295 [Punica granatum]